MARLLAKSFTAIANNMTPKNLRIMNIISLPNIFSILVMEDKTMKAKIMLINSPIVMLITAYSARNDSRAVKAPGPAIRGNAIGTIETPEPVFSVFIISTPNIISKANMNITKAPATAKDSTSTLKSLNSPLPAKKKAMNNAKDTRQACPALIFLFCF